MTPSGEELLKLNRQGHSYAELAKKYGMTRGAVAGHCNRAKEREKSNTKNSHKTPQVNKNTVEVTAKGPRIKTLDDLISAAKIDLVKWRIDHWTANAWEVTTREGVTFTNHQVKALLTARKPEAIEPVIEPVEISASALPPAKPTPESGIIRVMVWTDPHFGFLFREGRLVPLHDRRALDAVRQIMEFEKIGYSYCLGDVQDNAEWSDKFIRSPEFYFTTQPALIEGAWWITALGTGTVVEGNHDKRPEKAVLTHNIAAFGLQSVDAQDAFPVQSIPYLMGFEKRGVEWIEGYPEAKVWLNDGLKLEHGRFTGDNACKSYLNKHQSSTIFGHVHKDAMVTRSIPGKKKSTIRAYSLGCTCRTDGVVPGNSADADWNQSCAIVEYAPDSDWFNCTVIPIENGRAHYRGHWFDGEDRLDEIRGSFTGECGHLGSMI